MIFFIGFFIALAGFPYLIRLFMTIEILVKYIHFLAIFGIVASLTAEHLLLKPQLTRNELQRISVLDGIYGISSIVLLTAGLILWLGGIGKPAEIYSKNWIFHLKIGLFLVIGLLSIYPTVFFLKQRKGDNREELVTVPPMVKMMLRMELLILFILPLLATLMAKGVGFFGR